MAWSDPNSNLRCVCLQSHFVIYRGFDAVAARRNRFAHHWIRVIAGGSASTYTRTGRVRSYSSAAVRPPSIGSVVPVMKDA